MLDTDFLTISNYVYITFRDLQRKSYNIVRSTFLVSVFIYFNKGHIILFGLSLTVDYMILHNEILLLGK